MYFSPPHTSSPPSPDGAQLSEPHNADLCPTYCPRRYVQGDIAAIMVSSSGNWRNQCWTDGHCPINKCSLRGGWILTTIQTFEHFVGTCLVTVVECEILYKLLPLRWKNIVKFRKKFISIRLIVCYHLNVNKHLFFRRK